MILPSSPIYSKSRELWFHDGNMVLEAEDVVFKVHSHTLTHYSTVFRGMFTIPHSPNDEIFEDCPLVHLSDSNMDLLNFLKALYEARYAAITLTLRCAMLTSSALITTVITSRRSMISSRSRGS